MALPVLKNNSPGADSIDPAVLPSGLDWYAGYVGGSWPDWALIARKFGQSAWIKSVAVSAVEDADILDVERGDATVDQAFRWWQRQRARGLKRPGFYIDLSNLQGLVDALKANGLQPSEYMVWLADWDGNPVVPTGCSAKQYADHGPNGENYDRNVCNPDFFGQVKPVVNQTHYERFLTGPFPSRWGELNERRVVEQYDGARKHPILYAAYLKFVLRPKLQFLADRVAYEALYMNGQKRTKPDWRTGNRGWRYQQLVHRAQGERFV